MTTVKPRREFFFLQGCVGRLCAIYYHPLKSHFYGRNVLHVPAFAEEMNKSRRMVALQANALARAGIGVLIVDLTGTGDSEGDFGQAGWDIWIDDLAIAARWLQDNGGETLTLWGLRLGCLLAIEYAQRYPQGVDGLIYWQPFDLEIVAADNPADH